MCNWGIDTIIKLAYPMPNSGRTEIGVDACIAPLIQILNNYGIHTVGCCCGHGKANGSVLYEQDGEIQEIKIYSRFISSKSRTSFSKNLTNFLFFCIFD